MRALRVEPEWLQATDALILILPFFFSWTVIILLKNKTEEPNINN